MKTQWKTLYELLRGEKLGVVVAKELHRTIYADAIKQTDILSGTKLPWNAKYPVIKRIGGYDKPLEKIEAAVQIAIDTREQIQDTLKVLYRERETRINSTDEIKEQIDILEEKLRGIKNPTEGKKPKKITKADEKRESKHGKLEANPKHYKAKSTMPKRVIIIEGRDYLKQHTPVPTTELMETEDQLNTQMVNAEALESSIDMLDIIITDYRTLLQLFTKRTAYAKALSDVLVEAGKK